MSISKEMPKYQSHKIVWGLKIKNIIMNDTDHCGPEHDESFTLTFVEKEYKSKTVSGEYVSKHNPKIGGYYVVYRGGYESWSPADVFEAGYTRIS